MITLIFTPSPSQHPPPTTTPTSHYPTPTDKLPYSDGSHALGIAILLPRWMAYTLNDQTVHLFANYASNVWGDYVTTQPL